VDQFENAFTQEAVEGAFSESRSGALFKTFLWLTFPRVISKEALRESLLAKAEEDNIEGLLLRDLR
jgi:hypothetical protein